VRVAGDRIETSRLSRALGISSPTQMYPLYESAFSAQEQQTPAQSIKNSANLWQHYSEVAASNEYAWMSQKHSAKQIADAEQGNRFICWPYRKLMVANPSVNQAAAIIVVSLAKARAAGIADKNTIHIWGGAAAAEADNYLYRDQYTRSHAQEACLDKAVEMVGGDAKVFSKLELYSCFPVVPKMALKHLGLSSDTHSPTVAGGLTFFGGPLNNYMSHGLCAMVKQLRENSQHLGLLYAQGGFVTKHHTLVLSKKPAPQVLEQQYCVQQRADQAQGPVPEVLEHYEGAASIETYTVLYGRDGTPYQGVVILRTAQGQRTMARVLELDDVSFSLLINEAQSAVGTQGSVHSDAFGKPVWRSSASLIKPLKREYVSVEREGHLSIITINRPKVMNCLHPAANAQLAEVFDEFQRDDDQWVAILTGAGERAFCTGNDLRYFSKAMARGEAIETPLSGYGGLTARFDLNKPVIAAVNGAAMGGGFEIALACDLIIAAETAEFSLPEPKVGLAALAGGLIRLPRQIGLKRAMGMILSARKVNALEGQSLGFVNDVCKPEQLLACARAWADQILKCSPMAVRASKEIVRRTLDEPTEEQAYQQQMQYQATRTLLKSADLREGPKAFAEKREPVWRGK
ncbi:MAG: enoyl-CoA hydratase/isomerase family protein, partial [Spongiibacteraceae bacterium]|nr:enoyl-CoA hydratase/isomerase family protein [Spongiibacteraceae bacterium]